MSNSNISLHHVGARRGTSAFDQSLFRKDCNWVYYDADESCVDQIRSVISDDVSTVLPYCLYSQAATIQFNINRDPSTSSIYELNEKYGEFYLDNDYPLYGPIDYRLEDTIKTVRKVEVECTSLDDLSAEGKIVMPDILSIDAQGAAYDILEGAAECITSKTIAVCCEAEFIPFYKDQKLFGDLFNFIKAKGFFVAKFLKMIKGSVHREGVGFRGEGIDSYSDVLFLKDIDMLLEESSGLEAVLRLYKLAYTSMAYGYVEYAAKCMRCIKDKFPGIKPPSSSYVEFLDKFFVFLTCSDPEYLQSYGDAFSMDAVERRFSNDQNEVDFDDYDRLRLVLGKLVDKAIDNKIKSIVVVTYARFGYKIQENNLFDERINLIFDYAIPDDENELAFKLKSISENSYVLLTASHKTSELMEQLFERGISIDKIFVTGYWVPSPSCQNTKFENLLIEYNLSSVADVVKRKRLKQSYIRNPYF